MKKEKLSIKYTIKGIQPYDHDRIKGWVSILLVPMDPLSLPAAPKKRMMTGFTPDGSPIPKEAIEEMQAVITNILPFPIMQQRTPENDREIVIIEEESEFNSRGWKYGDQINVTFEKLEVDDGKKE